MRACKIFLAVAAVTVISLSATPAVFFVATNGSDGAAGGELTPWRTIQKAANTLQPGDTALVRGGIYDEAVTVNVSGSAAGGYVTFQAYPDETPVVDGSDLAFPSQDFYGLFMLTNRSYVAIQGFEIRNYQTNSPVLVPAGIWISGAPHDILLESNRIHDIANDFSKGSKSGNAYGIEVWGNTKSPITNLVVRGNELYRLRTGQSESFSLDGNVSGFEVSGNLVHDNNNIGIAFIGFEKVCPDPKQDFARNGFCRSNTVWNISSASNPTCPANDFSADGIYCDGASNIVIEANEVHHCDIGVEMASEHKGHAAKFCLCQGNLIWSNNAAGISIGGYSTGVGRTENCVITGNTLFCNNTQWTNPAAAGYGEFLLQYSPLTNCFSNNVVVANDQNLFISNPFKQNTGNVVDGNLYFSAGGSSNAVWQWKNKLYTGFDAYRKATGNDVHSVFTNSPPVY